MKAWWPSRMIVRVCSRMPGIFRDANPVPARFKPPMMRISTPALDRSCKSRSMLGSLISGS